MNITPAGHKDVDILADLNKHLIEDERYPNPMKAAQLKTRMQVWLQNQYRAYLVRIDDRVGAYCLYRDDSQYYYLRHLFVERDLRRKGIATALLDWMFANIWTNKRVRLDVLIHNAGAIAFYRHYGFEIRVLSMEK